MFGREVRSAGFSCSEVRSAGYSSSVARAAGDSCKEVKAARYSCKEAWMAGFTPRECYGAGDMYTTSEMAAAGFRGRSVEAALRLSRGFGLKKSSPMALELRRQ